MTWFTVPSRPDKVLLGLDLELVPICGSPEIRLRTTLVILV